MNKNYENNDSHNDVDHQTVNGKNMFLILTFNIFILSSTEKAFIYFVFLSPRLQIIKFTRITFFYFIYLTSKKITSELPTLCWVHNNSYRGKQ